MTTLPTPSRLHSISRINADCLVIGFNSGRQPVGSPAAQTSQIDGDVAVLGGGGYRGEASVDVFLNRLKHGITK